MGKSQREGLDALKAHVLFAVRNILLLASAWTFLFFFLDWNLWVLGVGVCWIVGAWLMNSKAKDYLRRHFEEEGSPD